MNFVRKVSYLTDKYCVYRDKANRGVQNFLAARGISVESLRVMASENNDAFKSLCIAYAGTLMPGAIVKCTAYACAVSSMLGICGYWYNVYCGFSFLSTHKEFVRVKTYIQHQKSVGVAHPFTANHIFVVSGNNMYECFEGSTSNIVHLDCMQIL